MFLSARAEVFVVVFEWNYKLFPKNFAEMESAHITGYYESILIDTKLN